MKAIAVILAAGQSARMGQPKALLEATRGASFLGRLVATFATAGWPSLAVLGSHAARIRAALPNVLCVVNPDWPLGQLSSVRVGLRAALAQGAQRVLMHPVDIPLIAPATVRAVGEALRDNAVVVPTSDGQPGHPLGLTAAAARTVLAEPLATLDRAVEHLGPTLLPVDDPAILDSLNTPEAYRQRFGHAPRLWLGPKRR